MKKTKKVKVEVKKNLTINFGYSKEEGEQLELDFDLVKKGDKTK